MIPCFNEATCMRSTTLEEDIALCAGAGFPAIELRKEKLIRYLRQGHTLEELRTLYARYGLKPACINALQGIYMATPQDKTALKDACDFLCYCARALGCTKLEYIAPYGLPLEGEALEAYSVESLRTLSDIAARYGVKLAVEYMALPGNSIQTFSQALGIIEKVDRENVGLLVDTWHHFAWGSRPEELLQAKPGQVVMVHISDCPDKEKGTIPRKESYWPGEGAAPITQDLVNLRRIGYEEEVSIEVFDPAVQTADPKTVIPLALRHATEAIRRAE